MNVLGLIVLKVFLKTARPGLVIGPKSQRRVLILGGLIGLALFIGGSAGLWAFAIADGPAGKQDHRPIIMEKAL